MIDRTKPPFSNKLPSFVFPEFEKESVNGFDVYFLPDKSHPIINLRLINLLTNRRNNKEGLNYAAMNLLTKGTKNRTSSQLAEKTEYYGASVQSSVNWDETTLNLNILKKFFGQGFDLFKDSFFNATYSDEEFDRFRNRQISIIQQEEADLNYYTHVKFADLLKSNVYASTLIGTENSIAELERDEVYGHYLINVFQSPKFVIVTGNYDRHRILAGLGEFIFPIFDRKSNDQTSKKQKKKSQILLIHKPENQQVNIRLGIPVVNPEHPDFPLLQLTNTIFGGYFLSRLNENLREKSGLTYGISSYLDARKQESHLIIGTSVAKNSALDALNEIIKEIRKLASEKVTEDELNRAKLYLLGTFNRMNETTYHQSLMVQAIITNDLDFDYYPKLYNSIKIADSEKLFEIQQKYFKTDRLTAVLAGDVKKTESKIQKLGIFDELKHHK